jgi:hypothetical protein
VVVANIQVKSSAWRPTLEKGSMSTAVGHGLADPKSRGKPVSHAN